MTTRLDTRDPLLARLLGRTRSLFADDIATADARLRAAVASQRILIVGAAGSIGSAFAKIVAPYRPAAIHLVDIDENGLVETVRDLRSGAAPLPEDFRTVTADFAGEEFPRFAAESGPYDVFANFAALKHVRAERDVYSLMRMIEVNVAALDRCLANARSFGFARVFSVSTDKSVRPANLMGASKNLMEKVLFSRPGAFVATSARFANVAFSAGSLLEGFEHRLAKGQPLAAPNDIRRYFMSHEEAAQLCLLACFLGKDRQVFFPKLSANEHLIGFPDIAALLLAERGLKPLPCASEDEARGKTPPPGYWPCHFAPSDTSGEKTEEEFHRRDDALDLDSFRAAGIAWEDATPRRTIEDFLAAIAAIRAKPAWRKEDAVAAIRAAAPELAHLERGRDLDQRM
ncbi:MAG: UDP-N-acetylglucosamine 4,6-dehydratase [Rhodospirillales bacterium]|nr:UDP-N-acetylglucosamine 4,6-dehydratase [Rhodospirillales bacterium]